MAAGLGDVLGLTFVLMPHGFPVGVVATPANKGRHPVQLSIATGKPIDLLGQELEVETQVLLTGASSATGIAHAALALVDRTADGYAAAVSATNRAAALVMHTAEGVARATAETFGEAGISNDDLEMLYLLGVL